MKRARYLPTALGFALALLLTPAGWAGPQYRILHTFTGGNDGGLIDSGFAVDADGNPYGMTSQGGSGTPCGYSTGCGVIFKLSPGANGRWRETVLLNFTDNTGSGGNDTNLLFDSADNLFGSTVGIDYKEYIFELTPAPGQWNFNPIYNTGGYCLVFDAAGNLYGCIGQGKYGGGAFGELSPGSDGWIYTDLYSFCPPPQYCSAGQEPQAPLTWDAHGNLCGTMLLGGNGPPLCPGSGGCGVAFQLAHNPNGTWTYNVLWRFAATKTDGYYPYAGLTVDAAGAAYGATVYGGKYDNGTFYKLTPTKSGPWKETILYQFPNCDDGCGPSFTLVADKAGNLYGSAGGGSTACGYGCGVIFELSPQKNGAWKYTVLHKFTGADGAFPYGVVLDGKGNLFGATEQGGKYNMGVVFELTP
jgi:hypothetical protein